MRSVNPEQIVFMPNITDPEVSAMTQAMYSRSNKGIQERMDELFSEEDQKKAKENIAQYYVGYGHRSIADCGDVTVYLERLSNIAVKAIQDTPLFNGQESSTRYLNFSEQPIVDPYNTEETTAIINGWLELYAKYQPKIIDGLKGRFPRGEEEAVGDYERALRARSFDITRTLLPSGVTTQTSWKGSLRTFRERLQFLKYHPLEEVKTLANAIFKEMFEAYPNSFKETDMDVDVESEEYAYLSNPIVHYLDFTKTEGWDSIKLLLDREGPFISFTTMNAPNYDITETVASRPARTPVPRMFAGAGHMNVLGYLDFGSFRDLQRHRNGFCPIPVVKDYGFGMNKWYMDEITASLTEEDQKVFFDELLEQFGKIEKFIGSNADIVDDYKNQYLYPLGMNLVFELLYDIGQCAYVSELRSTPAVHETLRPLAVYIGKTLNNYFDGAPVCRYDDSPSAFNVARGKQTIFKNGQEIE